MPKRSPESQLTSTAHKKQKVDAARTIRVQPPPPLPSNSMEGLPPTIDVERFAQARSFEIEAMQSSMKNVAGTSAHRVWQTLPRHLRRRAASHDVRRVPVRLREKAKLEIDDKKRKSFLKLLKRKKRMARQSKRSNTFARRQKNKTWLETHLWHAKRMHMQDLWGHRLAIRPTEKSYRPSHRAAIHGSTLHDASYMSTIELVGPAETLCSLLKRCCDLSGTGPWAARYTSGARVCLTHFHEVDSWPQGLIAPATVFWRPPMSTCEGRPNPIAEATDPEIHTVWIRIHPAASKNVLDTLTSAQSQYFRSSGLEIADLSGDVNAFEMVGPRTSQVIHGALRTVNDSREVKKFWDTLANARSSGSFSPGLVVGVIVHDPRLHYPPTNAKIDAEPGSSSELVTPSSTLAQSDLWDQSTRDKLRVPAFKKAALDHRRSQNLVPGTSLRPTKQDDRIPIILIQHAVPVSHESNFGTHRAVQPMHGWTILLPPSWSMAFLSSLIHTGTRVVGLAARHHQRKETNCPHFPEDYVGVPAYTEAATRQALTERARWERTPSGKRVNYESLGVEHPWASEWGGLVGDLPATEGELIPTDRMINPIRTRKPWLFSFSSGTQLVKHIVDSLDSNPADAFGAWVNVHRERRNLLPLDSSLVVDLFESALVHVRLDMLDRGNPMDRAMIYGFASSEAASQWKDTLRSDPTSNCSDEIIGYVTSGGFSLQVGHGHGIGAVILKYVIGMAKESQSASSIPSQLVKIRNLNGEVARPARMTLI